MNLKSSNHNVLYMFNRTEITSLVKSTLDTRTFTNDSIKIVALFKQQSICHNLLTRVKLIQVTDADANISVSLN